MAQGKNTTGLTDFLLKCMAEPDPMLNMLEWLCAQLMEAEVSGIVGAEKNVHNPSPRDYRYGLPPPAAGYLHGNVVSHGAKVAQPCIYPVFCHRA